MFVIMCVVVCMVMGLDSVRVSLLSMRVFIAVRMTARTVAMADVVEEYKADNVRGQTKGADNKDKLGLGYLLRFDKSLDGLEEDG